MVATERFGWVTGRIEASGQSRLGRGAILQAVTRVKPEQASKVKSWMPTPLSYRGRPRGQGRNRQAPVRSTGVLGTACREGDLSNWGRSADGGGRTSNVVERMAANPEVGEGQVPEMTGNAVGGKDPHFRCAFEEGEDR